MREIWLRPNVRAIWIGLLLPLFAAVLAMLILATTPDHGPWWWLRLTAVLLLVVVGAVTLIMIVMTRIPRLAYQDGQVLVYLQSGAPFRVPADKVECFFLGQTDSRMPGGGSQSPETASIVVRLAENAPQFHQRQVNQALGQWCGGYITIRGTYCERIHGELLRRLNARLTAVHRELREIQNESKHGEAVG